MRTRSLVVTLVATVVAIAASTSIPSSPADAAPVPKDHPPEARPCVAAKLRAAGRAVADVLQCAEDAAEAGQAADPACIEAAEAHMAEAFVAAEAGLACDGTVGAARAWRWVRRLGDLEIADAELVGEGAERARALRAELRRWRRMLHFLVEQTRDPHPLGLWIAITEEFGLPPGQPLRQVRKLRGRIAPLCGDDVRAAVEECDLDDDDACPFACRRRRCLCAD